MLFVDIEGDGLLSGVSTIWCMCVSDSEGYEETFTNDGRYRSIEEGIEVISKHKIVGHNIYGYDLPALQKIYGVDYASFDVIDTLTLSTLFNAGREGGHSLESWGLRTGTHKGEWRDFSQLSDGMIEYCRNDVHTTISTYQALMKEDWPQMSINLEHKIAYICGQQMLHGWKFDTQLADKLINYIDEQLALIEQELQNKVNVVCYPGSTIEKPFTKSGKLIKRIEDYEHIVGPFSRVSFDYPNLNSRQQLAELLLLEGWKPDRYTEKSQAKYEEALQSGVTKEEAEKLLTPVVDGEVLETLTGNIGGLLSKRFNLNKRKALIEGCYRDVRERGDGRCTAGIMSCGARSGRATHSIITSIPKAADNILLGKEIRSLFTVEKGNKFVGSDAAGIQLRILAHYMNDPNYINAIVNGKKSEQTDAHSLVAKAIGLDPTKTYEIDGRQGTGRDVAKTVSYALIFRAGDDKLGRVIGGSAKEGRRIRKDLMRVMPKYNQLVDRTEEVFDKNGYMTGLDGRRIYPPSSYQALNYLIQAGEAVAMKVAICKAHQWLHRQGVDFKQVGFHHDEISLEVREDQADIAVNALDIGLKYATRFLNLRCPLEGEGKIGNNWSIH